VSFFPSGSNPGNAAFRDYSPGPHSGVDTDPDAQVAPGSMDSRARNALTLGVISLVLGVLTGIPAIWFGRKALLHIDAADGTLRGRWAAWAGIALGCVGVVLTVGAWIYLHQRS
jgi:protein-S-isoprenylcysteine O-methyltransferase Ste14